MIAVLFTRLF